MKGCIITIRGNESGSRKPSRWIVEECINANCDDISSAIGHASVTGSIGATDSVVEVDGTLTKSVKVHRLCNVCGKKAGVYGAGHEECFKIENGMN